MAFFSRKKEVKEDTRYQVTSDSPKSGSPRLASGEAGGISALKVPAVLVQPRISEKVGRMVALNKYVFTVKPGANKIEVKKAVEAAYKVRVTQVNMVTNLGKVKNFGNRRGRTSGFKKAIVTLKQGDKIEGLTDVV